MISRYLILIFIFSLIFSYTSAQVDCEDVVVNICYLPDAIYCEGNANSTGCGYALDGRLMNNSLARKLTNRDNFGDFGTVMCPLELIPLTETITVDYIEDSNCDILFTGNFIIDTLNRNNISGDITSLSDGLLNQIRNWSIKESTNLVITTQAEAAVWGYEIEDRNENPNTSNGNALGESLFNGPFGFVPRFDQGGSYTGVITDGPSTGFEVLGIDNNGRPTIVLDNETNDIIIGDIGVFCGNGAGAMSDGGNINNNNDRLVANIFALGCIIAGSESNTVSIDLCPGEFHILPDGDTAVLGGTYIDSLLTINLCDSIITTEVTLLNNSSAEQLYVGCEGDGYNIELNGVTYDESNTKGEETIVASNGCDSIVIIDFIFNENSASTYTESICREDQRMIGNQIFDFNNTNGEVILQSSNNCDSIVTVMLDIIEPVTINEEYSLCVGDTLVLEQGIYTETILDSFYLQNSAGCDTLLIIDVATKPVIDKYVIPSTLDISIVEDYNLSVDIDPDYTIQWSPESLVSCTSCTELTIFPDAAFKTLSYTITNIDNCTITDSIEINYSCPVYIPNTFSPIASNPEDHNLGIMSSCLELISAYSLSIYDRWGNLVYTADNTDMRWDGFYNSTAASQGVYLYYMAYSIDNKDFTDSGQITLIR